MSNALDVTNANFEQEVLKSEIPVLVDFWAPWCGPCQMMGPVLDALAAELAGKVKITKCNVDDPQNQALASQYQIMSIPNMKLFKDGKVIKDFVGVQPKEALKQALEASL